MNSKNCPNKEINLKKCICTYEPCSRKGMCCECVQYHLRNNELPACFFTKEAEATYNRSASNFMLAKSR
ncbi:MAG: DUF6485 family protein [Candidatus Omnitrophica bacterium]|nr:DUF6485 family protein [Candidatus Omnitrophota bacterium]